MTNKEVHLSLSQLSQQWNLAIRRQSRVKAGSSRLLLDTVAQCNTNSHDDPSSFQQQSTWTGIRVCAKFQRQIKLVMVQTDSSLARHAQGT